MGGGSLLAGSSLPLPCRAVGCGPSLDEGPQNPCEDLGPLHVRNQPAKCSMLPHAEFMSSCSGREAAALKHSSYTAGDHRDHPNRQIPEAGASGDRNPGDRKQDMPTAP